MLSIVRGKRCCNDLKENWLKIYFTLFPGMHPITAGQFITGLHADRGFQPIEVYLRKSTTVMVALAWDGTTRHDEKRDGGRMCIW